MHKTNAKGRGQGLKVSPDDTDADEPSDNNSTDNLSFNSDDGNMGLIDDIILLPNNIISEDELSTNSDDCVYAYRGADFDPIPVNAEDENDFLEMDFEPDPASEIEQDNNLLLNNGLNVVNSFQHATASAINDIDAMDFGLGIKNNAHIMDNSLYGDSIPLNNRNDYSESPTNNPLNQRIDKASAADNCNNNKSHCTDDYSRKFNGKGAGPSTSNCDGGSNGIKNCASTAQLSYYDNIVVSLSTKKYTGTIPKTSRTTNNGTRTTRQKVTSKENSNKSGSFFAELKCRECSEKRLHQSPSSMWNEKCETSECKRCQALQSFNCMRNGSDASTSQDLASHSSSAQQPIPTNGNLNKRSMSFPVVNRHENGYTESTDDVEATSYPPSGFYGSSDPNQYDERNGHRLDPFHFCETHETDSSRIPENSVSIYSICFTEDIIVDALVSSKTKKINFT